MKSDKKKMDRKSLVLSKQTVVELTGAHLTQVVGGDVFSKLSACPDNPCTRNA